MEKYWYQGHEVLDILHWRLEDLIQACELGLKVYDESKNNLAPILQFFKRKYDYTKVFIYKFDINNYKKIQDVKVKITIKEHDEEYKLIKDEDNNFVLDNKLFSLSISQKGHLYFERYNNVKIKDINSFLREKYKNDFVDIDYISFLSDPLYLLQDNISNNEYIKLKSSQWYEKRIKLEHEFKDKHFADNFEHNLNYDEDIKITISCNIQARDNSTEEKKYIYKFEEKNRTSKIILIILLYTMILMVFYYIY